MSITHTIATRWKALAAKFLKRPDGDYVTKIHPYRRMLSYVMPGRNEAICYYDDYVKADALLDYIERANRKFHTDVTHCLVAAVAMGFRSNPKMNQFIVGKRLYRRNHVAVTFSMKRKKLDKEAKLSAVKMRFEEHETFEQMVERINDKIAVERSGKRTHSDAETELLDLLPRPALSAAMGLVRFLDYYNLLPASFIDNDGFYTSMFIANLGSLGMRPAFHHLYEWGTCPLFLMVGRIEDMPVVKDGEVVPQKTLHLRWSYDERIDDGLTSKYGIDAVRTILENPEQYFGTIELDEHQADAAPREHAGVSAAS